MTVCTCEPRVEHMVGCPLFEWPLTQAEIRVLRATILVNPHRHDQ